MTTAAADAFPHLGLSHFELRVRDVARMEDFYARALGFVVTDRGEGTQAMVFLSTSAHEHHQIVLNPRSPGHASEGSVDHLAFRVGSLEDVRRIYSGLRSNPGASPEPVSHGTTWSLYFLDPEGNRLEVFTDTPWYVRQPCRFPIDLGLEDDALYAFTENEIRDLPGFEPVEEWRRSHGAAIAAGHA